LLEIRALTGHVVNQQYANHALPLTSDCLDHLLTLDHLQN
jgi:hypothetical protein